MEYHNTWYGIGILYVELNSNIFYVQLGSKYAGKNI